MNDGTAALCGTCRTLLGFRTDDFYRDIEEGIDVHQMMTQNQKYLHFA